MRNAVGTQATGECFHSFFEPKENNEKRRKLDSCIYHQNVDSLHHAINTSFKFKLVCVSIEL